MEIDKNLRLARQAREDKDTESAKRYYQKVRDEDPENGEAKFFYAFYSMYEGTNGELPRRFENMCNIVISSVKLVKSSQMSKEEQLKTTDVIVRTFVPEVWAENRYMNSKNNSGGNSAVKVFSFSEITGCCKVGMRTIRDLGDETAKLYPNDPVAMNIAVYAWKEYVSLAQTWYAYAPKGEAEIYAEKIRKIDPSYTMPSKAGCISFGKKQ